AERLREVAEQFSGGRIDLLREQPDVVDELNRGGEHRSSSFEGSGLGERLSKPECAEQKTAFSARQSVDAFLCAVAVDKPALVGEPVGDRVDGRQHPWVISRQ